MKRLKQVLSVATALLFVVAANVMALEPNGTAIYNELGKRLYMGTLFVESPLNSAKELLESNAQKRLEIRFANKMSKRRWSQTWTQSIAINSPKDMMVSAAGELSEALKAFQSSLEYGDTVAIEYDPLYGTSLSVNGTTLVKEKSVALFNLFLYSWIGSVPPNSQFKNSILGKTNTKNDYTEFLAIVPSQDRIDIVKTWSTELKAKADRKLAESRKEEEAVQKAEEDALKKAEDEKLEEKQRLALVEEEKEKAKIEARRLAEEEAIRIEEEEKAAKEQAEADAAAAIIAQGDYTTAIITQIYKSVRYPKNAVKRNQQGTVRASVTLNKEGNVTSAILIEETEYKSLNKAVISAINKAAPFPAIPEAIKDDTFEILVPVSFKLE